MKILFSAAEAIPFSQVGGLADVAEGLPKALAASGHDVRVITPKHDVPLREEVPIRAAEPFEITHMGQRAGVSVGRAELRGVTAYLLNGMGYFDRPQIYGAPD